MLSHSIDNYAQKHRRYNMTVKIEFKTDNAVFVDDPSEVSRVLRHIGVQIDAGMVSGDVRDSYGNKIGKYRYE